MLLAITDRSMIRILTIYITSHPAKCGIHRKCFEVNLQGLETVSEVDVQYMDTSILCQKPA
jgi:hypothetical protein